MPTQVRGGHRKFTHEQPSRRPILAKFRAITCGVMVWGMEKRIRQKKELTIITLLYYNNYYEKLDTKTDF